MKSECESIMKVTGDVNEIFISFVIESMIITPVTNHGKGGSREGERDLPPCQRDLTNFFVPR